MQPILAGLLATAAMSVAMRATQAFGLLNRPPPGIITERALRLRPAAVEPRNALINVAAHFGYGAALALPFAAIQRSPSRVGRAPVAGMAYGLAVYVANYELMLPALRLLPPAHDDHAGRVVAMTAAHLVYGATLELLLRSGRQPESTVRESTVRDSQLSDVE
jgi:hypothetical protein